MTMLGDGVAGGEVPSLAPAGAADSRSGDGDEDGEEEELEFDLEGYPVFEVEEV